VRLRMFLELRALWLRNFQFELGFGFWSAGVEVSMLLGSVILAAPFV